MIKHVKHTRFNLYEYYWLLSHDWKCTEVIDGVATMVKYE